MDNEVNGFHLDRCVGVDADGNLVFRAFNYLGDLKMFALIPCPPRTSLPQLRLRFQLYHQGLQRCESLTLRKANKELLLMMEDAGQCLLEVQRVDEKLLIMAIIGAVRYLHGKQLAHGFICPEAIFIGSEGQPKLCFFRAFSSNTSSISDE